MKTTTIDSMFIDAIKWMANNKFISLIYDHEEEAITLNSSSNEPWGRQEFTIGSETYKKIIELELICRKRIKKDFKIEL